MHCTITVVLELKITLTFWQNYGVQYLCYVVVIVFKWINCDQNWAMLCHTSVQLLWQAVNRELHLLFSRDLVSFLFCFLIYHATLLQWRSGMKHKHWITLDVKLNQTSCQSFITHTHALRDNLGCKWWNSLWGQEFQGESIFPYKNDVAAM